MVERVFRAFAIGDIERGSEDPPRLPLRVAEDADVLLNPTRLAHAGQDPVIDTIIVTAATCVEKRARDRGGLVRMIERRDVRHRFACGDAVDATELVRPRGESGMEIEFPRSQMCGSLRIAEFAGFGERSAEVPFEFGLHGGEDQRQFE